MTGGRFAALRTGTGCRCRRRNGGRAGTANTVRRAWRTVSAGPTVHRDSWTLAPSGGSWAYGSPGGEPERIAYRLRLNPGAVHKVLRRYQAPPLAWTDPATGARLRAKPEPRAPDMAP